MQSVAKGCPVGAVVGGKWCIVCIVVIGGALCGSEGINQIFQAEIQSFDGKMPTVMCGTNIVLQTNTNTFLWGARPSMHNRIKRR